MQRSRSFNPENVGVNVIFLTLSTDVRAADMMEQQTQSDCVTFHSHRKDLHSRLFRRGLVHFMQIT